MAGTAERPYIDKTHPPVQKAFVAATRSVRAAAEEAGLDRALVELINMRVSQLNGCVACLSVHVPAAKAAGVDDLLIDLLPAWRQADCYSPTQRAVLALAEALTHLDEHALTQAQREAAETLSTEAIAAVEWVVITINAFNRISIASGHNPVRTNYSR